MTEAANIPERWREEYEIDLDIIAREKRKNRGKPDVWSQYRAWAETEKRLIKELGKAEAANRDWWRRIGEFRKALNAANLNGH